MLLVAGSACTDPECPSPSLIRWTEPERIASIDTDRWDLYRGEYNLSSRDMVPFSVLDFKTDWYPFIPAAERFKDFDQTKFPKLHISVDSNKKRLLLGARNGIAQTIPVKPGKKTRILVECKARFDPNYLNHAFVFQFSEEPELIKPYRPGILRQRMEKFLLSIQRLAASENQQFASQIITVNPNTRSLLFGYVTGPQDDESFEWVKFSYLKPWHEAAANRKTLDAHHLGIDPHPFISGVARPALFIPPESSITLKPMALPGKAEFKCTLGAIAEKNQTVVITITGQEAGGKIYEIVRHRLPTNPKD